LKAFLKIAEEKHLQHYPVHIKINTGMNRLGFDTEILPELISILKNTKRIEIKSIMSHLASSDVPDHRDFTLQQITDFERDSGTLMSELHIKPIRHICNTSGISNYPQAQFDMVRLGIGLYGVSNEEDEQLKLENVGTLKSVISQIRVIEAGESVGYVRKFMADSTTKVATIPIGYADGISRLWGNGVGYVTINGKRAPIIGSICMDMLMINVTGINCVEGSEVVIFGNDPSVIDIAKATSTIPYEILTSISARVKRVFYRE
jgi:alanine racemase